MVSSKVMGAFLMFALLASGIRLSAFETDQYNLPPVPLADIGDEMTEYVEENIRIAIGKLNAGIERQQACLERSNLPRGCGSAGNNRRELEHLRSDDAVAREVFKRLGDGIIPFTRSQTWLNSHKFRAQPARYTTSYAGSIYVLVPTNYLTISPTVKMYGASFGTDKIAHIFQQGYQYYIARKRELHRGRSEATATQKAVEQGVFSEKTYFGMLVSGVFSNADLAANYAGMRFYEGLTQRLMINGVERRPAVELIEGSWKFNEAAGRQLLRPFISDHLNEALNPSLYLPFLRSSVRRTVKKQSCSRWRLLFPGRTKSDYDKQNLALKRWNDEYYGFRESEKFITVGNTCF